MVSGVDENLVIYFMWPNMLQVFLNVHNLCGSTSLRGVCSQAVLVTLISVNLMLGGGGGGGEGVRAHDVKVNTCARNAFSVVVMLSVTQTSL